MPRKLRITQCKQSRFINPLLDFDLIFIFKSLGTALPLLERIGFYRPPPSQVLLSTTIALDLSRIFLEFFLKPIYPTIIAKSFKFMVLRLLKNKFVSQMKFVYLCPQVYISTTPGEVTTLFSQTKCFKNLFFPRREGENYGAENMAKIKLARALITSFDKFHSTICNLYFFGFCFVVP